MKFTKKKHRVTVDWKDGGVLYFERPTYIDMIEEWPELGSNNQLITDYPQLYGIHLFIAGLVGWDNVNDSEDKPIQFNKINRRAIIDSLLDEPEMIEKIKIAMKDTAENLTTGSTAS